MNCKSCGMEMPENGRFCPYCGADQTTEEATAAAQPPVEEVPESPEDVSAEKKLKGRRRWATITGCVAVMAVLALVLSFAFPDFSVANLDIKGWFDWEIFRENTIRKQDDYTVKDTTAEKKADVVVATVGDAELTNGELQLYYQMAVIQFVNENYYYLNLYPTYYNLDYTQPLEDQVCPLSEEGLSWQQYFVQLAIATWQQNKIMDLEAAENGFQLESDVREYLDNLEETTRETAIQQGYGTAEELIKVVFGSNTTMAHYYDYERVYYTSYLYFKQITELTDAELETYFKENQEALEEEGIQQDGKYVVDVRHILIKADGTCDDDGNVTFEDAEKAAAAKAKAEELLAKWKEKGTEEYFAELANEYSEDQSGNVTDGGIYQGVSEGQMVTNFNNWCFDAERQSGDVAIVETEYGYHIMYFSAYGEEVWKTQTQYYYRLQVSTGIFEELLQKYPMEVDYSKIALAYVAL